MARIVLSFGEIMGRLDLPARTKIIQGLPGEIRYSFAGAEANIAASICYLGQQARFITALPNNELGDACIHSLRGIGIDTKYIVRSARRLGTYYVETGANQRPSKVIYDRDNSAISCVDLAEFDLEAIFTDISYLHISGITPALSKKAAENTLQICRLAKERGIRVSCDLNFRKKLWQWDPSSAAKELAQKTMQDILQYVDLLIANEEDCADVLGIDATATDVASGQIQPQAYIEVARAVTSRFNNIGKIAITLRGSISASHNNWGAMLYVKEANTAYFAPLNEQGAYVPYPIYNIVDRVGGGDSFAAALLYALNSAEYCSPNLAIRFAAAASCLAHSIRGDFNYSSLAEVELLMSGNVAGRVQR